MSLCCELSVFFKERLCLSREYFIRTRPSYAHATAEILRPFLAMPSACNECRSGVWHPGFLLSLNGETAFPVYENRKAARLVLGLLKRLQIADFSATLLGLSLSTPVSTESTSLNLSQP